jgi:3-hydroxyisobutyrate dehydrogenase-like beta-hydroxyacid dehydrogenase
MAEARIAIIGLGEAGRIFAQGFAARGALVTAFDLTPPGDPLAGVAVSSSIAEAVADAEAVVSLVGAVAATAVAEEVLVHLAAGAVLADFNTAAPELKTGLAARAAERGALFADVAVLAPARRSGAETPLIASGTGAERLRGLLRPFGVPIESMGERAGDAAGLKLLRSVFMKGLAGVVLESLSAAASRGAEDWMRGQIAAELGPAGEELLERLLEGTERHAHRREHEMRAVRAYLDELGTPSWMTAGAIEWLHAVDRAGEASVH